MNLPSREECEGWDQAQVMQQKSSHLLSPYSDPNLSDSDLSRFSLIHQPQLQKIVQDIKKNDGSLLNKLRRLKGRPVPKLPARDYRALMECCLQDNDDQYEDPHEDQDDSYEPPPAHRVFSATPSTSFPRGEYLDSCRNRPSRPPNQPLRPGKASKQLPPTPTHSAADEEDYVTPDDNNDDDNYVEPEDEPPTHNLQNVYRKPWYAEACDRKTADDVLLRCSQDGGFMVRKSSGQDAQQPYTLVVFYKGRVYNIPIRYIPTTKQYALGREKRGEEYFSNVSHIIENHQRIPLVLIDSQSNTKDATKLCLPVKP
uniref:B cell linker n=1 Tax=Sphaeramia orbicularis TaxID=375764 RepID=A0A673C8L5_9TELE